MEINSNISKYKLFIATPMYGGKANANHILSMIDLSVFLTKINIEFHYEVIWNEALITRGRNNLVKKFLEYDYDLFLFIDADIGFRWQDVAKMIDTIISSKDKKIVCGVYPKKQIDWDKLHKGYKENRINSSKEALDYSSSFVVNFEGEDGEYSFFDTTKPVKVLESGTGFMMIHKEVFDAFKKAYPEQMSIDPDTRTELFYYFDCKIDEKTKYYLSEDYMFCRYASKIGYDTWILPWITLGHSGFYEFSGSFEKYSNIHYKIYEPKSKEN